MPVTCRPSLISRTVPTNSTTAPLLARWTADTNSFRSIGWSVMVAMARVSATSHRGNQCHFVAVGQADVQSSIGLVDRNRRLRRQRFQPGVEANTTDQLAGSRSGRQLELEFILAGQIAIVGKKEETDLHSSKLDAVASGIKRTGMKTAPNGAVFESWI